MGQTNHVQIGLVVLALIGLGLAYPTEQINSDEYDQMDLFGPYLDYIASVKNVIIFIIQSVINLCSHEK